MDESVVEPEELCAVSSAFAANEPPVPVAYALARLGHLNTELRPGDLRVRAAIAVSLRVWLFEHDGLLIRAVSADGPVTGVVLMISPSHSHRATPQPLGRRHQLDRRPTVKSVLTSGDSGTGDLICAREMGVRIRVAISAPAKAACHPDGCRKEHAARGNERDRAGQAGSAGRFGLG